MIEVWKPIHGYTGFYEVSSLGKIRSLDRTVRDTVGRVRVLKGKRLSPDKNRYGYLGVTLFKNNIRSRVAVSRVVAKAYVPNPKRKKQVNHKLGNKLDNRAHMVEWATNLENQRHAWKYGLKVSTGKLSVSEVLKIRELYPVWRYATLANQFGVCISTIANVVKYNTWKHV